jgi:hypothetical protein
VQGQEPHPGQQADHAQVDRHGPVRQPSHEASLPSGGLSREIRRYGRSEAGGRVLRGDIQNYLIGVCMLAVL